MFANALDNFVFTIHSFILYNGSSGRSVINSKSPYFHLLSCMTTAVGGADTILSILNNGDAGSLSRTREKSQKDDVTQDCSGISKITSIFWRLPICLEFHNTKRESLKRYAPLVGRKTNDKRRVSNNHISGLTCAEQITGMNWLM